LRLREPSIDFKTANDAGLEGLSDREVLELAARDERMLVSHDKRAMPVHFVQRPDASSGGQPGRIRNESVALR
jgi:hypothetical protein